MGPTENSELIFGGYIARGEYYRAAIFATVSWQTRRRIEGIRMALRLALHTGKIDEAKAIGRRWSHDIGAELSAKLTAATMAAVGSRQDD